jgi:hypothetical protein
VTADGSAFLSLGSLPVGGHVLVAQYSGDDAFDAAMSAESVHVVVPAEVSVAVSMSSTTSLVGQDVALVVDVEPIGQPYPVPTGRVQVEVDDVIVGAATALIGGRAQRALTGLGAGRHTIRVRYLGDEVYEAAWSGAVAHTVSEPAVTVGVTISSGSSAVGQDVGLGVDVEPVGQGHSVPTGRVQVEVDGVLVGATEALANGRATPSLSGLPVGAHTVRVHYLGDGVYKETWSGTVSHTVAQLQALVGISLSPPASIVGGGVGLAVSVQPVGDENPTPTGRVQAEVDGALLGGATVLTDGRARLSLTGMVAGAHMVRVHYLGDRAYRQTWSGAVSHTVSQLEVSVGLGLSSLESQVGEPVTLTATLQTVGGDGSGLGGQVRFTVDGIQVAGLAPAGTGSASVTIPALPVGAHQLRVEYLGDAAHAAASSSAVTHVVHPLPAVVPATMSVAAARDPHAGVVTLTAQVVAVQPGHVVTARPVKVLVNGKNYTTVTTDAKGRAVVSIAHTKLRVGKNPVIFTYATGLDGHLSAVTVTKTVTVKRVQAATLKVTRALDRKTAELTLTVKAASKLSGYSVRGRTVALLVNGKKAATAITDKAGRATFAVHGSDLKNLRRGANSVMVKFSPGSARYRPTLSKAIPVSANGRDTITNVGGTK